MSEIIIFDCFLIFAFLFLFFILRICNIVIFFSLELSSSSGHNTSTKIGNKNPVKPIASSLSDFSSDDDQPLIKKSRKSLPLKTKSGTKPTIARAKQLSGASR